MVCISTATSKYEELRVKHRTGEGDYQQEKRRSGKSGEKSVCSSKEREGGDVWRAREVLRGALEGLGGAGEGKPSGVRRRRKEGRRRRSSELMERSRFFLCREREEERKESDVILRFKRY